MIRPKQSDQLTIQGDNLNTKDEDAWGDEIKDKHNRSIRILQQNVQGLPFYANGTKNEQMTDIFKEFDVDILLLSETNLYWPAVPSNDSWSTRMRRIKGTRKSVVCHNITEEQDQMRQYGGVAIIVKGDIVHRISQEGSDDSGLGRWAWIAIEGKKVRTRVISVYRPQEGGNTLSVAAQHKRHFAKANNFNPPREIFDEHLLKLIDSWESQGDRIIIGGDFNEDIRDGQLTKELHVRGLCETVTTINGLKGPATQQNNTTRTPIDGIFSSVELPGVRGGYLAFGEGIKSDHRATWVDVSSEDLYNTNIAKSIKIKPRRLRSDDPKLKEKYLDVLDKFHHLFGIYKDMDELAQTETWTDHNEHVYNELLKVSNRIRVFAEHECRKLKMGNVEWSPALQSTRDAIHLWLNVTKRKKGGKVCRKFLARLEKKACIYDTRDISLREAESKLKEAYRSYKLVKQEASQLRDQFLEELAESKAEQNNTSKDAELKKLKQKMKQKRLSTKIKNNRPDKQKTATTKIFKRDENGNKMECLTKREVEEACLAENHQRFTQIYDTPFLQEPLARKIGLLAETEYAEQILEGTFEIPEEVDKYTKLLIHELRRPQSIAKEGEIDPFISEEQNRLAWKKQKESISSEGLHFGHYKASCELDQMNKLDAQIRTLPYKFGFAPSSWKQFTDVAILKKAGIFEVEKMRTIQLFESQLNMNNKQLGRDVMKIAESKGLLADEQYGSRKRRRAVMAALNKRLTFDLLRQKKKNGGLVSNDAKSCYDRVAHAIAILAMRRLGATKGAVTSMFLAMQEGIHRVRTAYGNSQATYDGEEVKIQGIAQGNGAAPTGWACISTPIINILKTMGFGLFLFSAITMALINFVCYAFVDDTDVIHTPKDNNSIGQDMVDELQAVLDHWEGGVRATGGAIVPIKTFWTIVDFIWTGKKWRLADSNDIPGEMTVRTADGSRSFIRRSNPHIGEETLGVYMAIDGSEKEEVEDLRKKSVEFASWIKKSNLTPQEIKYALNSIIAKSLEYSMEAVCITKKQWDYIMAPILMAALPKMKICRTFPRDVVYGPLHMQGIGICHPFIKQGFVHLKELIQEPLQNTITSQMMKATVEQLRVNIGFGGNISSIPDDLLSVATSRTWIQETINFIKMLKMDVFDKFSTIPLQRVNDGYLMSSFVEQGYRGGQLSALNFCRIYCRVNLFSDVITGDGKKIRRAIVNCQPDGIQNKQYDWPRQVPGLHTSWTKLWKEALIKVFSTRFVGNDYWIDSPLGDWIGTTDEEWNLWFHDNRLYLKDHNGWKVFQKLSRRRTSTKFVFVERTVQRPNGVRATGDVGNNIIHFTGVIQQQYLPNRGTNVSDIRRNLPEGLRWAIGQLAIPEDMNMIITAIEEGRASAVSDGSFKNSMGTSAFTIGVAEERLLGVNQVPGDLRYHSPYRAELSGVIGVLVTLKILCESHIITSGKITIGLDGKSVINRLSSDEPLKCDIPDFDLFCAAAELIKKLPIEIDWHWVEGHQDDHMEYHELDEWAQLNVLMDSIAKQYWQFCVATRKRPYQGKIEGEFLAIFWNHRKLTRFQLTSLYDEYYGDVTGDYWISKDQLKPSNIHSINWEYLKKATLRLPFQRRTWLSQQLVGMLGVNKFLAKWDETTKDVCPICLDAVEDSKHVYECQDPRVQDKWELSVSRLEWQLENLETPPEMIRVIINRLLNWRDATEVLLPVDDILKDVVEEQTDIGWKNFLFGRLSTKWTKVYETITECEEYKGKRWTIAVIHKLILVAWDFWDHRNAIKHSDLHPWKMEELMQVEREIIEQFKKGDRELLKEDRKLLKSMASVMKYPLDQKRLWIDSLKTARSRWEHRKNRNVNKEKPDIARMRASLYDWLTGKSKS